MSKLKELINKLPPHLVIEKALWIGDVKIDINHIDNNLNKPLNYIDAFERMSKKLKELED